MKISQMVMALLATSVVTTVAAAGTLRGGDQTPRKPGGMFMQPSLADMNTTQDASIKRPEVKVPDAIKEIPKKVAKWKKESDIPKTVQVLLAFMWVFLLASAPFVFPILDSRPVTRTQISLAGMTILVLLGGFYLFTNVILFQSSHFDGNRTLTVIECIYFMAQTVTTVGYGDIGPAKTRGQLFVGVYVIFSLFVLAIVVEDFTQHVIRAASEYKKRWLKQEAEGICHEVEAHHAIDISFYLAPVKPNFTRLYTALAVFAFFDITFIMFFRLYPGEGKTVFEATYMSLITLATVGFGFFTPVTEAGMIFNAFWMVAGCSALVNVIGEFTALVYLLKAYERHNRAENKIESMLTLKNIASGRDKVTESDFLQFCLVSSQKIDKHEIDIILKLFKGFNPKNGVVDMMAIQHATTPRNMIVT